jgi:hypothetical protein
MRLEKFRAEPSGVIDATKPSSKLGTPAAMAFFIGKSVDDVEPVTTAFPSLSTAILVDFSLSAYESTTGNRSEHLDDEGGGHVSRLNKWVPQRRNPKLLKVRGGNAG